MGDTFPVVGLLFKMSIMILNNSFLKNNQQCNISPITGFFRYMQIHCLIFVLHVPEEARDGRNIALLIIFEERIVEYRKRRVKQ